MYGPSYTGNFTRMLTTGNFTRMLRGLDMSSGAYLLREIYMSSRERFVHIFEMQPLLPNNSGSLSVVKALVSLGKLDESPLLKEVVVSTTNSLRLIDFVQHTCSLFKSIPFSIQAGVNLVILLRTFI
jgi:hypothetical protein